MRKKDGKNMTNNKKNELRSFWQTENILHMDRSHAKGRENE